MKKRGTSTFAVVCIIIITAALSSAITLFYVMGGMGGVSSPLQKYARLETIRKLVEREYYTEVDDEVLLNGALKGMMSGLKDPYSYYITPEEAKERAESEKLTYYGFGMTVRLNDNGSFEIIRVDEGSPAEKAGIVSGDEILAVDGKSISGMDFEAVVALLRSEESPEGSQPAQLKLLRGTDEIELNVARETIAVSNISTMVLDNGIGYIGITQFVGDDVQDFEKALQEMEASDVTGLIIDLRDNPGGYLDHVVKIADMLLPEALIVYTQDRNEKRVDYYSDAECNDLPLCVLVNDNSASASEIFAAAVKDNNRGVVIGTRTFGKGIVQSVYTFEDDGAEVQFTSSTYYTPGGECIHGSGVVPNVVEEDADLQLEKAIEFLTGETGIAQ